MQRLIIIWLVALTSLGLEAGLAAKPLEGPARYRCNNGLILHTQPIVEDGVDGVQIDFEIGWEETRTISLTLPLDYADEVSRFEGALIVRRFELRDAMFETRDVRARFKAKIVEESIELADTMCRQIALNEGEAVMQAARAGRYFVRPPEFPAYWEPPSVLGRYLRVEGMCLGEGFDDFFAFAPGAFANEIAAFSSNGEDEHLRIDPLAPDAGIKRFVAYEADDDRDTHKVIGQFATTGSQAPGAPNATAGLLRLSRFVDPKTTLECVDGDDLVYYALSDRHAFIVSMIDGELVLRFGEAGSDENLREIKGGYFSTWRDGILLTFFDGADRVRIATSDEGFAWMNALGVSEAFETKFSNGPAGYFVANPEIFERANRTLPGDTANWLEFLEICNTIWGEVGFDQERKDLLAEKWIEFNCVDVGERVDRELANLSAGHPMHRYLTLNRPDWIGKERVR